MGRLFVALFCLYLVVVSVEAAKKCRRRISGSRTAKFESQEGPDVAAAASVRLPNQDVYFWPSLTDKEKKVIRDAFFQIGRRTCLTFKELDYKPWYHADRWEGKPYVIIRKSKSFTGYSDNDIEDVSRRSILYLTDKALNNANFNISRGAVMDQLVRFMGLKEELHRPDAASYVQAKKKTGVRRPKFTDAQLQWPFDPESVTVPYDARDSYDTTIYCPARSNKNLGAGQRAGLLTRWDAVKLNSMYCPDQIGYADPRMGPCVVERKGKKNNGSF
uniref:Metalloprotease n=1 Tax=Panagrellus redivivus TaxID=6233 RepID=A0A7E4VSC1_PANRE